MKLIIFFLLISGVLLAQQPFEGAGTVSNLFLRSELSARTSALAGAFTGVSDDESAIFYNPAGLANIRKGALALNHAQWFEDIMMENLVFGYNFDNKLGVGISISHMWMPPIQGKNYLGQATGDVDVSSTIVSLGLGYKVHSSFYAGVGVKYFQDNLASFKADGLALDAGIYLYTAVRGLTWGLAVQNIGGQVQYDIESEDLPLTYRTGLAYRPAGPWVRIAVDVVKPVDQDIYFSSGVEFTYSEFFSLRIGNQFKNQNENIFEPSFGAGFNISEQYLVDYTYYNNNDLGMTHKVGFTFRFNLPGKSKKDLSYLVKKYAPKAIPPSSVDMQMNSDKVKMSWTKVASATYNIYVRASKSEARKRLNKSPLYSNMSEFSKPNFPGNYYISITSIVNNVESDYSNEAILHVD